MNAVYSLGSTAQAQATLDNLSGEGVAAAQNAGVAAARVFTGALADEALAGLHGGGAVNQIVSTQHIASKSNPNASRKGPIVTKGVEASPAPRGWRVWSTGFGGAFSLDGKSGVASQTGTYYGGALGLDYQIQPNILAGVAVGGSSTDFTVSARATTGTTRGFHAGVYGLAEFNGFYGSGSFTAAALSNKTSRAVTGFSGLNGASLNGSFDSLDLRGRVELGRVFDLSGAYSFSRLKATPFAAFEVASLHTDRFNETSPSANVFGLSVASRSQSDLPLFVGARIEAAMLVGNGLTLRPNASLAYVHNFAAQPKISAAFLALPAVSYNVAGARLPRDAVQTKAGFELDVARGATIFANFDGEFANKARVYGGKGGLRFTW